MGFCGAREKDMKKKIDRWYLRAYLTGDLLTYRQGKISTKTMLRLIKFYIDSFVLNKGKRGKG